MCTIRGFNSDRVSLGRVSSKWIFCRVCNSFIYICSSLPALDSRFRLFSFPSHKHHRPKHAKNIRNIFLLTLKRRPSSMYYGCSNELCQRRMEEERSVIEMLTQSTSKKSSYCFNNYICITYTRCCNQHEMSMI